MTTGTRYEENVTPIESATCAGSYSGHTFYKVWSGGDGLRSEEHAYEMFQRSTLESPCEWYDRKGHGPFTGVVSRCFGLGFYAQDAPVWSPVDEYKLISQNISKLKGHDFNAAVNLGELKESIKMVGDTARQLAKSILFLKRGKVRQSLKALGLSPDSSQIRSIQELLRESAASAWLGMQYGWLPLLGAVTDAAEALASRLNVRQVKFKSSRQRSGAASTILPGNVFALLPRNTLSVSLIWKVREDGSTTMGELGFLSPELVAWELLPFSFVGDWFVPIGQYLESRSTLNTVTGKYIRTEYLRQSILVSSQETPEGLKLEGESYKYEITVRRTVGEISDMPLPRPLPKDPFSLSHMLSGIALLQAVFLSK